MISNLAKETIEAWQGEGLAPTFEDAVRLNALGLKIEKEPRSAEFSALPRVAFLGDWVLTEPTVGKWLWIDSALAVVRADGADLKRELEVVAYAMNTPDADLAAIKSIKNLNAALDVFRREVLAPFAYSQIEAAVEFVMYGGDPTAREYPEPGEDDVREVPEGVRSTARALLSYAVAAGIDEGGAKHVTVPHLERMIAVASMIRGADVLKSDKNRATGEFYRTADAIFARLKKDKEAK